MSHVTGKLGPVGSGFKNMKSKINYLVVLLSLLLTILSSPLLGEDQIQGDERVLSLLERALDRAAFYEEKKIENEFKSRIEEVSKELDSEGKIEKEESLVYLSHSLEGFMYRRLVERNGQDLTPEEKREELKKEQDFIESVKTGKPLESEENRVRFNRSLTDRYMFEMKEEIPQDDGSKLCILSFRPKPGKLPVNNRMDRALNESVGELWIDENTAELVKVKFGINKKMKLWWGLIGSIYELTGMVERKEIEPGIWLTDRVQFYVNGRIFFSKFRKQVNMSWEDYSRIE